LNEFIGKQWQDGWNGMDFENFIYNLFFSLISERVKGLARRVEWLGRISYINQVGFASFQLEKEEGAPKFSTSAVMDRATFMVVGGQWVASENAI